eukprot:2801523-Rhodomonas_salina.1
MAGLADAGRHCRRCLHYGECQLHFRVQVKPRAWVAVNKRRGLDAHLDPSHSDRVTHRVHCKLINDRQERSAHRRV